MSTTAILEAIKGSAAIVGVPCPTCNGTGFVPNHRETGAEMRRKRIEAGLTASEVARRMMVSGAYISDLERGRRGWGADILSRYSAALNPEPGSCPCSPGDQCSCAYDCDCRDRFHHVFEDDTPDGYDRWRNTGVLNPEPVS